METIDMYDIFDYVGKNKRPLVEGERLFKASHVVMCGILRREEKCVEIIGLCLQTSHLNAKPHEIRINIKESNGEKQMKCICSCVAGLSGHCKHVVAVLFLINKESITNLEDLSCTDLKQQWGKLKNDAKKLTEVVPISKFCHVTQPKSPYSSIPCPDAQLLDEVRKILTSGKSQSEAAIYERCGDTDVEMENSPSELPDDYQELKICLSVIIELFNQDSCYLEPLPDYLIRFFNDYVCLTTEKSIDLCIKTINQRSELWKKERRLRITGSICYSILTYIDNACPDWTKKVNDTFFSTFRGNKDTIYGLKCEPFAVSAYEKAFGSKVAKLGLFVQPIVPFLGYSADGLVMSENVLLEVKCPVKGKKARATDLVEDLKYLTGSLAENNLRLKEKHKYFAQIQLGMGLFNCKKCHFVIFSLFDKSLVVLEVPFNDVFFRNMITKFTTIYFSSILPVLYEKLN